MCETCGHDHGHPDGRAYDRSHGHDHGHEHGHGRGHSQLPANAKAEDFRVVVTGKGGVGKTSLTALLALRLARRGLRVLSLDADPQVNLPWALGLPAEEAQTLTPLSENWDYVEETTGARPGDGWGLFFRLNPKVDDVVDRYGTVTPDGVRLLVMGNTVQPAAGCLCPENALLAAVVNAIGLREGEAILMDTQAGFEHFGRALARGFRHAVVVADPTFNGVQAALHAARLARQLDIGAVHLVVNGVRDDDAYRRALERIDDAGGFDFASSHRLPWDETLRRSEPLVAPALDEAADPALAAAVDGLLQSLVGDETRTRRGLATCAF
ncbi:MAG TPA: AAA family ATPase [Woeseiaceae bacterium]|nr:AAA family ATPase [Woeseiaceae bacterium]